MELQSEAQQFSPGMLLGIFGESVPPGSPNPDPVSDQKMSFSTPVFWPLKSIPVLRPGPSCSKVG